jgi:hypothetical protein
MIIWIVINHQGPIQAFQDRVAADEFANKLNDHGRFTMPRVVSCELILKETNDK